MKSSVQIQNFSKIVFQLSGSFKLRIECLDFVRERGDRLRDCLPDRDRRGVAGHDVVAAVHGLEIHGASRIPASGSQARPLGHAECSAFSQSGISLLYCLTIL